MSKKSAVKREKKKSGAAKKPKGGAKPKPVKFMSTATSARKKNPPGQKVEIEVELPLTDAEARKRYNEADALLKEHTRLLLEKKETVAEFSARIKDTFIRAMQRSNEGTTGKEVRKVSAIEVKDHRRQVVEYWFNGERVKERPMVEDDKQEALPLKGGKAVQAQELAGAQPSSESQAAVAKDFTGAPPRGEKQALESAPPRHDPVAEAHAADEAAADEDIANVIASETNRRTKSSAVDGPTP